MTKKDYVLLAEAIKSSLAPTIVNNEGFEFDAEVSAESTALAIADALAGDNPRFNRDRFLAACGL